MNNKQGSIHYFFIFARMGTSHLQVEGIRDVSFTVTTITTVGAACSWVVNIITESNQLHTVCTCVYRTLLLNEVTGKLLSSLYSVMQLT